MMQRGPVVPIDMVLLLIIPLALVAMTIAIAPVLAMTVVDCETETRLSSSNSDGMSKDLVGVHPIVVPDEAAARRDLVWVA
jgi:hypothetical protein